MKTRVTVAVGLLVLTASWVGAAEWEDSLRKSIDRQKDDWNEGYEEDGDPFELRETGPYLFKELVQGNTWEESLELEAGREYVIMAVCDAECNDIDLYAYDQEGLLEEDTYEDAVPVVEFEASDGAHGVEVEMLDCGGGFCRAAIGVFEKTDRVSEGG